MSTISSGLLPHAAHRQRQIHTAATTPSAIISPYTCSGTGPIFSTLVDGLGIEARRFTAEPPRPANR